MSKTRHKYDYHVNSHSAAAKIVRMVGQGRRVLELGSGPGSITRLLHANHCRVVALEIDSQAIEIVSPFCEKVVSCNLNDSDWPKSLADTAPFDTIVAGDVLEHLYDPWETLAKLSPILANNGQVVLSIPHAGHNAIIASLLSGKFEYQPWGLLDRTHIRFFGVHDIQNLVSGAGFKIIEADFVVKEPEQTEFAKLWRSLPTEIRAALGYNRFGSIYQVVLRLVPEEAPGKAIRIEELEIPNAPKDAVLGGAQGSRAVGYLLSFLILESRARLSRLLQAIGILR